METIIVRVVDIPLGVNGYLVKTYESDYCIYINARLSQDAQYRALNHELKHIAYGHCDDDTKSIAQKEYEADSGLLEINLKQYEMIRG